ncbi:hypothetical protein [uncultured Gimesia sp.]|uniref:hypothetical protein n=1 Tax=uncultured Gimesia sp. TaxID=1678688 RepID=UPI0030DAAAAD
MNFQANSTNEPCDICPDSKVVFLTADDNKPQSAGGLITKLSYSWTLWLGQYRITLEFVAIVLVLFTLLRIILVFTYQRHDIPIWQHNKPTTGRRFWQ